MEFRTLEQVPIVTTGTYALGTGEATFTADDLAAAVLASKDPAVPAPRIKIGHTDRRFESDPELDGEPAMGTVRNLTLTDDGQTIVGDLVDVPAWLADSMHSAYPGRSIEGGFGYSASSGHDYGFVISDVALLGTTWPGVGTLADLRDVLEKNGPIDSQAVAARSESFVMAKVGLDAEDEAEVQKLIAKGMSRAMAERTVKNSADEKRENAMMASLDVASIPRAFAADLRSGKVPKVADGDQAKWWPRSVEAADDGSLSILVDADAEGLLRLPITIAEKDLSYGEPIPVAASTGSLAQLKGPRVLASWPSTAARPNQEAKIMKLNAEVDQTKLAVRLGLPEDADEAAINAALTADEKPLEPANTTATTASTETATSDTTVAASAKIPEGMVLVDAQTLETVKAGAAAGQSAAAKLAADEREAVVKAAIEGRVPGDGGNARIAASQRDAWIKRFEADPDGTRKLLTAKADEGGIAALIPASAVETGRSGDGEGAPIEASAGRLFSELNDQEAK